MSRLLAISRLPGATASLNPGKALRAYSNDDVDWEATCTAVAAVSVEPGTDKTDEHMQEVGGPDIGDSDDSDNEDVAGVEGGMEEDSERAARQVERLMEITADDGDGVGDSEEDD